ncbi:MAG TPA: Crp/Fnr family transcriptional regulator [Bacteroidales bacterium]|jgi:CRP-like cAMP-binding protein|nr:Crp/Fnr family transcriptional regulator [Bacteroidales bacterium]
MTEQLIPAHLTGIPQEERLTQAELNELGQELNVVAFRKREVIFRQQTPASHVLFVKSGLVKIYKEGRNKRNFILKIASPGEFIGLMSVFGSSMNQFSASAVDSAEIGYLEKKTFVSVMQKNGEFAKDVIRFISEEGLFIFERLIGQSHKQLPGRIADVILYFSDSIYKKEEFEFPFTRRELAELAGTTKESFIRTLSEFKNDKIISLDGSKVIIKSMKIIRTLSELG